MFIKLIILFSFKISEPHNFALSGAASDADECFSDSVAPRAQMLHLPEISSQYPPAGLDDSCTASVRSNTSDDMSPRLLKQLQPNSQRDLIGQSHGGLHTSNGLSNAPLYSTPSPVTAQVRIN